MQSKVVLAIGAHPDDIVLGFGGMAVRLVRAGWEVVFLCATLGECGGDPVVRREEEILAARRIGAKLEFGGMPDAAVKMSAAMPMIRRALERYSPSVVFVHDDSDTHDDHVQLSKAAMRVCQRETSLYLYEGPTTTGFQPSLVADISEAWEEKCRALDAHQSQVDKLGLQDWIESVGRFRAWPRYAGAMCEAFRAHSADIVGLLGITEEARFKFAVSL
jgi:LmbE family N-acetylglucosaminyl deacetylase